MSMWDKTCHHGICLHSMPLFVPLTPPQALLVRVLETKEFKYVMLILSNMMLVLYDFLYILNFLKKKKKIRVPNNVMVGTIICEVGTVM
jgi:hypothetical protein